MEKIQEMIHAAKTGDTAAFNWLYANTYQRNYYIIIKIVKTEQDTQDVLQDTYVKIFQNLESYQYQGEQSFFSWAGRIASNTALNFLRKKNQLLFSDIQAEGNDDMMEIEFEDESIENRPDLAFEQKETSRIVQEMLECLSEEQRICIVLRYVQQMKISEIALQCGCSENTIKSRLNYAKKHLLGQRETLERKGVQLYNLAPFALLTFLITKDASAATNMPQGAIDALPNIINRAFGEQGVSSFYEQQIDKIAKEGMKTVGKWGAKRFVATVVVSLILVGAGGGLLYLTMNGNSVRDESAVTLMTTSSAAVSTGESATPEPTPELTEEDIFYKYLRENLIPKYGVADVKQKGKLSQDYGTETVNQELEKKNRWFKPKGIISAHIADMDSDNDKELFVIYWEKKKDDTYHHKLKMEVYEIQDGEVVRMDTKTLSDGGCGWAEWLNWKGNFSVFEMAAGEKKYFLFSQSQLIEFFGDGRVREMWSVEYRNGKFSYVQEIRQTEGGSDDFTYTGYTHTGKKKKGEVLYDMYDEQNGLYDSADEAFIEFFGREKIDVREINEKRDRLMGLNNTESAKLICTLNSKVTKKSSKGDLSYAWFFVEGKNFLKI